VRILVTGHSGFLGGHVAERLAGGHVVVGVSRRSTGRVHEVADDLGRPGIAQRLAAAVEPCDVIVHAGASLDRDPLSPALAHVNCGGTQELVGLAEAWGAHLVFVSSISVIGRPQRIPVGEDHPTAASTPYVASKLFGEHVVTAAAGRGLRTAILRLTSPIGPGMPEGRIVSAFVQRSLDGEPLQLLGRGTRRQDYVDVRDAAAGIARCIDAEATGLFNLGFGRSVSNLALANRCVTVLESASAVRFAREPDPEDGVHWDVSVDAARAGFGYAPEISLDQSLLDIGSALTNSRSPRRDEFRK
jgi:UDP-glucose 4-epimerase